MGRKLKTALNLLHSGMRANVLLRQLKQKIVHDEGARKTHARPGDYAQNCREGPRWLRATVTATLADHTANVTVPDGRYWRRNQEHLPPEFASPDVPSTDVAKS